MERLQKKIMAVSKFMQTQCKGFNRYVGGGAEI